LQTSTVFVLMTYATALKAVQTIGIHVPPMQSQRLGGELTKATVPFDEDEHLGKLDSPSARTETSKAPSVLMLVVADAGGSSEEHPPLATTTPPPAITSPARMLNFIFELLFSRPPWPPRACGLNRAIVPGHRYLSAPGRNSEAALAVRANTRRSGAIVDR
jgi:hypothetical protein